MRRSDQGADGGAPPRGPQTGRLDVVAEFRRAHPSERIHSGDASRRPVNAMSPENRLRNRLAVVTMVKCPTMTSPPRPSQSVKDHPAPLTELFEIFDRRSIAVGIDSSGQVVLARPDSLLAEIESQEQRKTLARYVDRLRREAGEDDSRLRRRPAFRHGATGGVERESINGQDRWTFSQVQRSMRELACARPADRIRAEPCVSRRPGRHWQPSRRSGELGWRDGVPRQRRRDQAGRQGRQAQGDAVHCRANRAAPLPAQSTQHRESPSPADPRARHRVGNG